MYVCMYVVQINIHVDVDKSGRTKTFHRKWKSQRVLIAFYYLFIRSLLLWTHGQQCKKNKLNYWNVITHLLRVNAMKNLRFNSAFFETARRCWFPNEILQAFNRNWQKGVLCSTWRQRLLFNKYWYLQCNYNGIHFSFHLYSGTTLYGHPLYTDSFVCPDKKLIYFL